MQKLKKINEMQKTLLTYRAKHIIINTRNALLNAQNK